MKTERLLKAIPGVDSAHDAVARTEQRVAELTDQIGRIQSDAAALKLRRQSADELVQKLTAEASRGALKNPERLTAALQERHQLNAEGEVDARLQVLVEEKTRLEGLIYSQRREAASESYRAAVMAYASAAADARLHELAAKVRELAPGAGVELSRCLRCGHDGMHQQSTFIGGAEVALKGAGYALKPD